MSRQVVAAAVTVLCVLAGGCATKKFVRTEVGNVNSKVDTLSGSLEETQERTRKNEERIGAVDAKAEAAGRSAQEARGAADAAAQQARQVGTRVDQLQTALYTAVAASRRLVFEVTLSEDQGQFKSGRTELPDEARARLDEVVGQLKGDAKNVFIEIEGHTDNIGAPEFNQRLGLERAEAVERYLYDQHQVPLHKMNVISYGEEKPVAPNTSRVGRAENRRVVVKVITGDADNGGNLPTPTVRASRVFAGPGQFPPNNFAAYGIVAFRAQATSQSRARYEAICEGYLAAIAGSADLEERRVPLNQQMVTVWPLGDAKLADQLNVPGGSSSKGCTDIISGIDIITSGTALEAAARANQGATLAGVGPFLIAWSPSTTFGTERAIVLLADLSRVTTVEEAQNQFLEWKRRIEQDPQLWSNGWNLERLRTAIRQWADKFGPGVLSVFGISVP